MSMQRRFGGAGIRRGVRVPARVSAVDEPDPNIAGLMAMGPAFLYVARADLVTTSGGNVLVWADRMNPNDSSRELTQAVAGSRPAYVASSSLPSGVPVVQGDGTADHLFGNANADAYGCLNNGTVYALFEKGNNNGGHGSGSTSLGAYSVIGCPGGGVGARRIGLGNLLTGSIVFAGTTIWVRQTRNAGTTAIAVGDSNGNSNSGTAGHSPVNRLVVGASLSSGTPSEFAAHKTAIFVGFSTVLSGPDQAAAEAYLEAYAGM